MDKIDSTVRKIGSCITLSNYMKSTNDLCNKMTKNVKSKPNDPNFDSSVVYDGIYIQTMFAIATYQLIYNISHNDLHDDNVFVEFVTDKTMYDGKFLIDADWYHYSFQGNDIYVPAIPVIVKIGDYGLSVKYSDPIIGNKTVFETGYDQYDYIGPWIPNKYIPQYDSLFFTSAYTQLATRDLTYSPSHSSIHGTLITECAAFIAPGFEIELSNIYKSGFIKPSNSRPILPKLNEVKTALDILNGPILKNYSKKPKSGKIVTLGLIE